MSTKDWTNDAATMPEQPREPRRSKPTLQLMVLNGRDSFTRPLERRTYVLGRGADAEVNIASPGLSRQHALLTVSDVITVEDCGSRNGTFVRGERLAANTPMPIASGEPIELGAEVTVIVHGTSTVDGPPAPGLMAQLERLLARIANVDAPILIQGETGTGKDVLARRIHAASRRANGPFVAVNCGAIAETLADSELFGYERGAFTGAQTSKPGLLDAASGGTLFLDEIGDMPAALQVKLLRVLESGTHIPVGATQPRVYDVRFIAATHHDLKADVERGAFRRDLYHRIDGVTLSLPPLRDRRDEIGRLAAELSAEAAAEQGVATPTITAEVLARLLAYDWPGNVRELRQVMRRAVLMAPDGGLALDQLPGAARPLTQTGLKDDVRDIERVRILEALESCAGNQTRAAKLLGIARSTLVARMEEFGVPRPRKR